MTLGSTRMPSMRVYVLLLIMDLIEVVFTKRTCADVAHYVVPVGSLVI